MLLAVTIQVTTDGPAEVPAHLGRATQGAFLAAVRAAAPELAATLHGDRPVQPYTTAWLGPRGPVPAGAQGLVRWTALTDPVARALRGTILPGLPPVLDLDGAAWQVTGWTANGAAGNGWAGETTCPELARRYLLDTRPAPPRISLLFATPTTFHSAGRCVPWPLPRLVFGSLLERWNAVAPLRLSEEVLAYAEQALAISSYDLRSEQVVVAGGRQVGFTGRCTYVALAPPLAPPRDGYALLALRLLAAFAFYAGVGAKTTMGLGQARARLP